MPAALSESGQALLADLPAYLEGAPAAQAVVDALAREIDRLEIAAAGLRAGLVPHAATDANGMLPVWEQQLGLPVRPVDATEPERQSKVLANFRKRRASTGADWVSLLTTAIGSTQWTHSEVSPYSVQIVIPQAPGSYTAEQVRDLARRITPANLELTVAYEGAFLLDYSLLDQTML